MRERRSAFDAQTWQQGELIPKESHSLAPGQGVGGRRGQSTLSPGGGGYLNDCTGSEVGNWPRKKIADLALKPAVDSPRERALLAELAAMGLSNALLTVASAIGFDAFMTMWQILDQSDELLSDSGSRILARLPRLSAYRRYQRNRFVELLASMGLSQPEIRNKIKRELGEEISNRHTRRLMASRRVRR